nr:hypothetical protein [Tanacetum cinerariifolium]
HIDYDNHKLSSLPFHLLEPVDLTFVSTEEPAAKPKELELEVPCIILLFLEKDSSSSLVFPIYLIFVSTEEPAAKPEELELERALHHSPPFGKRLVLESCLFRKALKEAADLAGWELKKTANGAGEKLVGMDMRINDVLSSLKIGVQDVRMIEIKGIGGENSQNPLSGLKKLQKQILMDVFNDQDITNSSVSSGKNTMRQMLHRKKLLIVLDDVNDTKQLEALCGASNWFKLGSRIIITTRDNKVLVAYRVNFIHSFVHKINVLSADETICLFSRYAFGKEIPIEEYKNLSGEVVKYADGLFLTIKVLGSFLSKGVAEALWIRKFANCNARSGPEPPSPDMVAAVLLSEVIYNAAYGPYLYKNYNELNIEANKGID